MKPLPKWLAKQQQRLRWALQERDRLSAELDTISTNGKAILERAKSENRILTADERDEMDGYTARLAAIKEQADRYKQVCDSGNALLERVIKAATGGGGL